MPPSAVPVSDDVALAIARRNGVRVSSVAPMASAGIINSVFSLDGRYVLRVPRDHPVHVAQAIAEASAIPLAVAAGVRTPPLVAFDDTCDLVPVPVLIVEQVDATDLEAQRLAPDGTESVWEELGADLARLHHGVDASRWPTDDRPTSPLVDESPASMHELLDARAADGWLSYVEVRWLGAWLDRLGPITPAVAAAVHGDVQLSNVLTRDGTYAAIVDWGCANVKDPIVDFLPLPFRAAPAMLRGHRQVAPLPDDDDAERRILLGRLHSLLSVLPRGAAPGMTWGERPIAWLTDLLRFFQSPPSPAWRELAPPV